MKHPIIGTPKKFDFSKKSKNEILKQFFKNINKFGAREFFIFSDPKSSKFSDFLLKKFLSDWPD